MINLVSPAMSTSMSILATGGSDPAVREMEKQREKRFSPAGIAQSSASAQSHMDETTQVTAADATYGIISLITLEKAAESYSAAEQLLAAIGYQSQQIHYKEDV